MNKQPHLLTDSEIESLESYVRDHWQLEYPTAQRVLCWGRHWQTRATTAEAALADANWRADQAVASLVGAETRARQAEASGDVARAAMYAAQNDAKCAESQAVALRERVRRLEVVEEWGSEIADVADAGLVDDGATHGFSCRYCDAWARSQPFQHNISCPILELRAALAALAAAEPTP
jgi:hypothetical protein